jgi:dTDP-4-dehydrorhamnose reductase
MELNTINKRILVTGANGLLGQKLVALLLAQKFEVMATGRGTCRLPEEWERHYQTLDVTKEQEVQDILGTFRPDAVVHAAAMTQADECENKREECYLQNVTATQNLAKACKALHAHLVFVSSDFVFDGEDGPYRETDPPNPVNYYGHTKFLAEKVIQEQGLPLWSIVRTVLVYGTMHRGSRSNIILWVKNSLEEGKNIQVVDDQWRTPTLVEDLAEGILGIIQKQTKGIFNICGPDWLTPYQMALATADYFDLDIAFIHKVNASTFTQAAKRPPKTGLILDKAQRELDFRPKSFAEGIGILAKQLKLANS